MEPDTLKVLGYWTACHVTSPPYTLGMLLEVQRKFPCAATLKFRMLQEPAPLSLINIVNLCFADD